MKKTAILFAIMAMAATAMAQNNNTNQKNIFSIQQRWIKTVGYSYQPGYPYGFSLAGGSLLSVGFAEDGKEYIISATEKREPTWSMRFGWLGYSFNHKITGWGAVSFRPMLVLGFDKAKDITTKDGGTTWEKESNTYFTMAPTLVVNLWMIHVSVGYEFVPKFKELNGLNFGVGLSIPLNTSNLEKKAENWATDREKKKR